jgi:hypothetical protein
MLQRILGGLTVALMAASFSGNNSSASQLEDSLAVTPELAPRNSSPYVKRQ